MVSKPNLRLPAVLAVTILGGGACNLVCSEHHHYFCLPSDPPDANPGAPDADPAVADAAPVQCPDDVENPEDCPPGCEPIG